MFRMIDFKFHTSFSHSQACPSPSKDPSQFLLLPFEDRPAFLVEPPFPMDFRLVRVERWQ